MNRTALLLDIGNSATKWLYVDALGAVRHGRAVTDVLVDRLVDELGDGFREATALVASVAAPAAQEKLSADLMALCKNVWFAQSRGALDGLVNSYAHPERMGVDRWLAMLAARRRVAGRVCVVDAGSALTVDLVAADGRHEGGYIIPGTALMERVLFADTGRVRDSAPANTSVAPGRSTAEAVSHGILLAQAGAVTLATTVAEAAGERPELLLCGGGALQLASVLKLCHEHRPDLVFEGLLRQAELEAPQLLDYSALAQAFLSADR